MYMMFNLNHLCQAKPQYDGPSYVSNIEIALKIIIIVIFIILIKRTMSKGSKRVGNDVIA